jgi:diacylglycerol O-acyltransferase
MTADLPVGDPDPVERLRFVHAHMASRKDMGQAVGADALMELTGYAPPTVLALASRLAVRTMPLNTVITNIPGPQMPLYCLGARMLEAFPYVCVVDGMAMIIAVISYDGHLAFGLSGDRSAVPDLHVLAEGVESAFTELEAALLPAAPRRAKPASKTAKKARKRA